MASYGGREALMDLTASLIAVWGVIISSSIGLLGWVDALSSLSLLSLLLPDALETEVTEHFINCFFSGTIPALWNWDITCAGLSYRYNCFSKPGNVLLSKFDKRDSLVKCFKIFFHSIFKGLNTATSSSCKAWEQFGGKHTILILFSIAVSTVLKVKWLPWPSYITRTGFWLSALIKSRKCSTNQFSDTWSCIHLLGETA